MAKRLRWHAFGRRTSGPSGDCWTVGPWASSCQWSTRLRRPREQLSPHVIAPGAARSDGPFGTGFLGPDYMDRINDEVFLAVQIETVEAVENAAETNGG